MDPGLEEQSEGCAAGVWSLDVWSVFVPVNPGLLNIGWLFKKNFPNMRKVFSVTLRNSSVKNPRFWFIMWYRVETVRVWDCKIVSMVTELENQNQKLYKCTPLSSYTGEHGSPAQQITTVSHNVISPLGDARLAYEVVMVLAECLRGKAGSQLRFCKHQTLDSAFGTLLLLCCTGLSEEANGSDMEVTYRDAAVEERCGADVEGKECRMGIEERKYPHLTDG
ncbi:hypothetical protein STEG23_003544 [Scotinomys teguina]